MKLKKFLLGAMALMVTGSIGITSLGAVSAVTTDGYKSYVEKLEQTIYTGDDLGATYSEDGTTFKVWAPDATSVVLNLFATGSDEEENAQNLSNDNMTKDASTGVWSITKDGDLHKTYYTYSVTTNGNTEETGDIYAKACGVNGDRSMVVDLSKTNPEGFEEDERILFDNQTQAVIWEVHVKDFSNSASSGVSEENRGKYLAFTESDTTLNKEGDLPTCINYLKSLGVNAVQINPFYDYASVDETITGDEELFNWGYDPKNYNVPEGSYSSDPYNGDVRINEAKQMIKALHEAGIAVIMDVVYNHTYEGETSFFNKTVPNYYYRFTPDGQWSNASVCGNDTASEHEMYRKFMVDSVYYWATEYNLDGFRFDLMGLHDVETMNAIIANLDTIENGEKIIMYGEAWDMAQNVSVPMASQDNMDMMSERIGAFNDSMRDALKGDNFLAVEKGFVQGKEAPTKIENGIIAQTNSWSGQPSQTVTYATSHDNLTLYDKLIASGDVVDGDYETRYESLVAMNKLTGGTILTSQGITFMVAGEEMGRTKLGDHNSYKSSALINEINWNNLTKFPDVIAYYTGMIDIRNNFAPFTNADMEAIENIYFYQNIDQRGMAFNLKNTISEDTQWSDVVCIYNSNIDKEIVVELEGDAKDKQWVIVVDDKSAGLKSLGEVTDGKVEVKRTSMVMLVEKESYNAVNLNAENEFINKLNTVEIDNGEEPTTPTEITDPTETTTDTTTTTNNGITLPQILIIAAGVVAVGVGLTLLVKKNKSKNKE